MLFDSSLYTLGVNRFQANILFFALFLLFVTDLIRYRKGQRIDVFLESQNLWFRWIVLVVMIVMIVVYGAYGQVYDAKQFIYFQF